MRNIPLLFTVTCVLFSSVSVVAQNDSSRLDAGSLVLKREFTQHISIKGEDLEKMPFANLSQAINVWLNGVYSVSGNLVYVVDGNIVSDVNAYNVHDIEEVVLLQNAAALTSTALGQQEMVLITTRKSKDRLRVRGATQTFLVHSPNATTDEYFQNYAGIDANFNKISFGASADYLQDVVPKSKGGYLSTVSPYTLHRERFNAYFAWRPDVKNTVEVHVGYVPQTMDSALSYAPSGHYVLNYSEGSHEHDQQFSSWARWRGEWLPGLRNDLQVGYIHLSQKANYHYQAIITDSANWYDNDLANTDYHTYHIYVRDRISYSMRAGGWSLEPSVNASYEYLKEGYLQMSFSQVGIGGGGISGFPGTSIQSVGTGGAAKLWVLTPALDIQYKQLLYIQGGVMANVSHQDKGQSGATLPRTAAFGSIAIDVLRLDGAQRNNSLKLFGSYAQRSAYFLTDFNMSDLDGPSAFRYPIMGGQPISGTSTTGISISTPVVFPKYWVWEAGARWSVLKDRLQIEYNFQRRNFSTFLAYQVAGGYFSYYFDEWKSSQHRLGVNIRIIDGADLSWQAGLNTTVLQSKTAPSPTAVSNTIIGDHYPGNSQPSWTGGWTNRVQYHRLSLGIDMLYHFSGEVFYSSSGGQFQVGRDNSWLMQNIYIGYKVPLPKNMGLEVYVDSRGLVRGGNTSYNMDARRYYGVGGKIVI
jgi:hypothetical protein